MLGRWAKNFINLIYPLTCLTCQAKLSPTSDQPLCPSCWQGIRLNLPPFCRVCGRHLPAETQEQALICRDCQQRAYFFNQAYAVCIYDGIIKECIHLLKYRTNLSLAKPLGKLMVDFAARFLDMSAIDLIVPVPLHRVKKRQRQFNQAQLLAQPLATAFGKKLNSSLLCKVKSGTDQVKLPRQQRLKNVQGAFKVRPRQLINEKNILVIDDVLTTQATANECARMLRQAGAASVEVFALARSA